MSSPVVAGDAVYFGSSDNNLYSVNRADGSLRWKFATKGAVNSSPAFADGIVYVNSVDGRFYAVDAATGKEKWNFKTAGEHRFTAPGIHGGHPRTEMMADPFDAVDEEFAGQVDDDGGAEQECQREDHRLGIPRGRDAATDDAASSPAPGQDTTPKVLPGPPMTGRADHAALGRQAC